MQNPFTRTGFSGAIFTICCVVMMIFMPGTCEATASVDHMTVTVYYTESGGGGSEVPVFSWWSLGGAAAACCIWNRRKKIMSFLRS